MPVPVKAASSLAGPEGVLFVFLWLEIKEFIGLILKSQEPFKDKGRENSGPFSPERTKY